MSDPKKKLPMMHLELTLDIDHPEAKNIMRQMEEQNAFKVGIRSEFFVFGYRAKAYRVNYDEKRLHVFGLMDAALTQETIDE